MFVGSAIAAAWPRLLSEAEVTAPGAGRDQPIRRRRRASTRSPKTLTLNPAITSHAPKISTGLSGSVKITNAAIMPTTGTSSAKGTIRPAG